MKKIISQKPVLNNLICSLGIVFLMSNFSYAKTIKSISLSGIKDTVQMVLEVDTTVKSSFKRVSKTNFQLTIQAQTFVENIKPMGIIKKIEISGDSLHTDFDITFNKPYDFRKQNADGDQIFKFSPVPVKNIKTIVLDPGHGGIDLGAVGRKHLQEKEANLAIAKALKKKLENYGLRVLLTRPDDRFVALSERTRFANDQKADLFISIHCNSSANSKKANGFETYFLSDAKTDWERAVLTRENSAMQYEDANIDSVTKDDVNLILADLSQNENLKESYALALEIQTAGVDVLKDVDRGVKQAGFYVLRGNFMPAVLVECGFLSNLAEEKKLNSGKYRESVAQAIFLGIVNYIQDYDKRTNS